MATAPLPATGASALEKARVLLRHASGLEVSDTAILRALREVTALREGGCGYGAPGESTDSASTAWLDQISSAELAALIERVVVPESWMFRDPEAFAAATAFVQARLASKPGRLQRILSLPCAGGEEPYTMAMALAEANVAASAVRIDGVDLSQVALERARAGWYTRNAFRGGALDFRERHFSVAGSGFQISEALRSQVNFSHGNILTLDTLTGAGRYDVIFCRNLLIYFDSANVAAACAVLRTLLADDGMLLAGYAEVPQFCAHGFAPLRLPGAFALQKAKIKPKQQAKLAPKPEPKPQPQPPARMPRAAAPVVAPAPMPARRGADDAVLAQARSLADGGDGAAATALCRRLLAQTPPASAGAQAEAYYLLGLLADSGQDGAAAVAGEHWRRCVYLRPDHYEALCRLALLAEQAGDAGAAAALRQRAARVFARRQPDSEAP